MTIAHYIKEVRHFIEPYFKNVKFLKSTERCCISFQYPNVLLTRVTDESNKTELLLTEKIPFDNIESLPLVLADINRRHLLSATPIYWLLSPDDYQLFLMDSLPVKSEELLGALTWRARNLLSYPIEEALIDYFQIPGKKGTTGPMIALVASRKNYLDQVIPMFKNSGLNLTTIYLQELALRNLIILNESEEENESSAMIYFYENGAILNITHQKTLYITRRLTWTSTTAVNPANFEQICLDMLRYFDFFQSQWRLNSPKHIYLAADKNNLEALAKSLNGLLSIPVNTLQVKVLLKNEKSINLDNEYLLTYGCAIKKDVNVTPRT